MNSDGRFRMQGLWLHGAAVVALALVFLPVVTNPTQVLYSDVSDLLNGHLPYRHLMAESLREHGSLPLYDPTAFGGIPLIGDPQSGIAYPPNWLHAIGSSGGGPAWFGWSILLHLCVGAFGVLAWLRGRGFGAPGRLAGALAFALCGKWLFHIAVGGHVIFAPLVWVPWQLALIDRLDVAQLEGEWRGRLRSGAMLAVVTALAIIGLHPQLLLYSQTLVALYAIRSFLVQPTARWRFGLEVIGAAVLGLGLAAVHLLPVFDSLDLFVRGGGLDPAGASARGASLPDLAGFLLPSQNPRGWEECLFVGAAALVLAGFAPWRRQQRGLAVFFLVVLAGTVVYALGDQTPLHRWVFDRVPGFDLFRLPRRGLLILGIPLAFLVACGVETLCDGEAPRPKRILAALCVVAAVWLLTTTRSPEALWAATALGFPALCLVPWPASIRVGLAGLAVLLLFADGARFIAPRVETRPLEEILGENRVVERLADGLGSGRVLALNGLRNTDLSPLIPAYATPAGIESLRGYNPLIPRATLRYLQEGVAQREPDLRVATTIPSIPIRSRRHLDLFDTRWVVTYAPRRIEGLALRAIVPGQRVYQFQLPGGLSEPRDVFLYENRARLPRAFLVRFARRVASFEEAIAEISRFDPRREVLVEAADFDPRTYPGDFRPIDVVHDGDEISLDLDAGEGGYLVLSEIAYPGWRASADGAPLEISRANGIFQAVELGPGRHDVLFSYLPRSFELGRAISIGSIGLVIGMLLYARLRRTGSTE